MTKPSFIIPAETQNWLLDPADPGARYLAMLKLPLGEKKELSSAMNIAHQKGPINVILEAMNPDGYWINDGPGYLPKYRSSAWSLILLSQLGAKADLDDRIAAACKHYLDSSMSPGGQISATGTPSGTADCLQGNMLAAMMDLGFRDTRIVTGFEWMARTVTGSGLAPMGDKKATLRYYAGKIGPDFLCGANNKLACAWGAVKVLHAFGKLPLSDRNPLIDEAIQRGIEFIFSTDPATAGYPNGWNDKPSGNWWKFGFPVFYVTDLLQICEALVSLGYAKDPRLENAIQLIRDKKMPEGKWPLEYGYRDKTWVDFGEKKLPNKWVTIRAFSVLQRL